MMTGFVDTHTHLYDGEYRGKLGKVLENAWNEGVSIIFCVSEDIDSSLETLRIAEEYRGFVYPFIGIHPWIATHQDVNIEKFQMLLTRSRQDLIGMGEIGLDKKYIKEEEGWRRQKSVFMEMLALAEKHGLPIQVHSRGSALDVLEIILMYNVRKVQFHWFSDTPVVLNKIIDNGFYVSFTPSITYSKRIRRLASIVPPTQVLSETDSPVSFYGRYKGMLMEPKMVVDVVETFAEIYKMKIEEMAERVLLNLKNLYKINIG
jgi:TatD DNase family protein